MIYPPQVWKCPQCERVLKLFVKPSAEPTCKNPTVHTSKEVIMVRQDKNGDKSQQ